MEENLEILGTRKVSFLSMAGSGQPMTVVEQQTGWREGTCRTQITSPYATKKRKQSTISSLHVSSPDSSGFSSCSVLV
jgi:hypothetical protein